MAHSRGRRVQSQGESSVQSELWSLPPTGKEARKRVKGPSPYPLKNPPVQGPQRARILNPQDPPWLQPVGKGTPFCLLHKNTETEQACLPALSSSPSCPGPTTGGAERKQHPSMERVDPGLWKEPAGRPMRRCTGPRPGCPRLGSDFPGVCGEMGGRELTQARGRGWTLPPPPPDRLPSVNLLAPLMMTARRPVTDFLVSHPHRERCVDVTGKRG